MERFYGAGENLRSGEQNPVALASATDPEFDHNLAGLRAALARLGAE